ncbi:hypothetical protein MOQ72_06975 [Saccharopolyspora sp. K220]|uniref:hypothetical protein n=1 Tax=Saccharopolyspora soli TaxID=2926618 RepID=UPI001F577FA8|nr:hypothetical protein [Saccharopolyspora soli]MCI2417159.1 hypothetical protein [Saccharopolyspora soli]
MHSHRDQPRLRAVVQVALDAAQLGSLRIDGCGSGLGQLPNPLGQRRSGAQQPLGEVRLQHVQQRDRGPIRSR